jgi:hypothetical protein
VTELMCEECDFRGIPSWSVYRHGHVVHHDEHLNGVRLRRIDRFERVAQVRSTQVLLVQTIAIAAHLRECDRKGQ